MATTVVATYIPIVRSPILANFEISLRSEIPLIKDAKINGIAISFNSFTKIVPAQLIHLSTNSAPPST